MNEAELLYTIETAILRRISDVQTEISYDCQTESWDLDIVKDIRIQGVHYNVEVLYYVYDELHTVELYFGVPESSESSGISYDAMTGIGAFRVVNILKQFYLAVFSILHEKVGIDRIAICPTCERRWRFYNRTIKRLLKKIGIDIPIVYI